MNATPIVLLCGAAGSGKDTVGKIIADDFNGVCLGQADPMKRFASKVFGFDEDQLWGPSEQRNAVDFSTVERAETIANDFDYNCVGFVDEVLPGLSKLKSGQAVAALMTWFDEFIWDKLEKGVPLTPRYVLQTIGTEWGRQQSLNMWSDYATKAARALLSGGYNYSRTVGVRNDDTSFSFAVITDGRFRNEILNTRILGGAAFYIDRQQADAKAVEAAGVKGHKSEAELGGIPSHFYSGIIDNNYTLDDLGYAVRLAMQQQFRANLFSSRDITVYVPLD